MDKCSRFVSKSAEPDVLRAVTKERPALLRSLSHKTNDGVLVHRKVSLPQFMQKLVTACVIQPQRLTKESVLTSQDIMKLGETPTQLA